jgi:hypothetical protein
MLLWVHDSSLSPGFWGLSRTLLEDLERSGKDWYVVLLTNPGGSTYVVSSSDVTRKRVKLWRLADGKAYKVHENHELDGLPHFHNHGASIRHVLGV